MRESWLKCKVSSGMFSDEYAETVGAATSNGTDDRSLFISKDDVRIEVAPSSGRVRVKVFERDSIWWAVLPTEDQEVIRVGASDLTPT